MADSDEEIMEQHEQLFKKLEQNQTPQQDIVITNG